MHNPASTTSQKLANPSPNQAPSNDFDRLQDGIGRWLVACFGKAVASDKAERNHRFLEEALELVQSLSCTREEAHMLVDYVFDRPVGVPFQEVGGVTTTLGALCETNGINMGVAAQEELRRVWGKIEQIRAKQATKPKNSPLPGGTVNALIKTPTRSQIIVAPNEARLYESIRNYCLLNMGANDLSKEERVLFAQMTDREFVDCYFERIQGETIDYSFDRETESAPGPKP